MISPKVMNELHQAKLVPTQFTVPKPGEYAWSPAEQRRFWKAIQRFPEGPWTAIAAYVGSKSTRQAMTHAQKLRQKLSRWKRRVRNDLYCSVGFESSVLASLSSPVGGYAGMNETKSITKIGKLDMLSIMDHTEKKDKDIVDDCKLVNIITQFKSELQQFDYHDPGHNAHDDHYLEHLLSGIEPVLEHVAHFTNDSRGTKEATRPRATAGDASDLIQSVMHHTDINALEHRTLEHTWSPNLLKTAYYQHHQQHSTPSPSTPLHYTTTQGGHQRNYIYHL